MQLPGPAGGDAGLQQLPGPHHRPPGAGGGRRRPSSATAPGVTGSRLLNGTLAIHRELEELLADWVGLEAALVFTTGYAANLGLLGALVGPDDAAIVDSAAHASLVDGARFSEGTLRAFRHNRPNSLRRTLRSWREQPDAGGVLVAVDGIYSMEGDWAPLAEIAALCRDFGARLLVDEAHALGVVGPRGAGTARRHRGPARPDHGHVLQVAGQLRRVHRRPAAGHRLPEGHLPAADVHGVGGAGRAWPRPWRRPASPRPRIGGGRRSGPGRAAASRAGRAGLPGGRPGARAPIVAVQVGDNWEAGLLWKALLETASTPTAPSRPPCPGPCCGPR